MVLPCKVTPLSVAVFATLTQSTILVPDGTQKADWDWVWEPWVKLKDLKSKYIERGPMLVTNCPLGLVLLKETGQG